MVVLLILTSDKNVKMTSDVILTFLSGVRSSNTSNDTRVISDTWNLSTLCERKSSSKLRFLAVSYRLAGNHGIFLLIISAIIVLNVAFLQRI